MPFNGSGVFSIVNTFVPNTTILSAAVNQNFTDIATGLSDCLTRDGQAGMTAAFKAISGSLSAPGISFNSDTTSGLYLSSSGIVGLVSHSLGMLLNTTLYTATSAVVQAGGSGYAVGDTITATGGTAVSQPVFTVATLSGSAVATVTVTYPGFYSVKPTNPVSQGSTSGTGTGCTLNVTYNDPASSDYRAFFSDQTGGFLWQKLGASSYMSGLMNSANALALARGIGSSALAQVIGSTLLLTPQGILSPLSSTSSPIPTSDQTAVTRIYWTPFKGNVIPIYDGTSLVLRTSGQIFCDLTAGAQASGGIYDIYAFMNSGVVTLGLSPTWSAGTGGSVTAGSCARGTGSGGTALTFINGVPTNAVSMTVNNSSTTYTVPISQGTLLGSVYINGTAGQYNCHVTYGQSRVWGLYNAWNQRPLFLQAGDSTSSWTYTVNTIRPSNNSSANSLTTFSGLPQDTQDILFNQAVNPGLGSATTQVLTAWTIGIGQNSTSAFSGMQGQGQFRLDGTSLDYIQTVQSEARILLAPTIGINTFTCLERTNSINNSSMSYLGANSNMLLSARWPG